MRVSFEKLSEEPSPPPCLTHRRTMIPGTLDIENIIDGKLVYFGTMDIWRCPVLECDEKLPRENEYT